MTDRTRTALLTLGAGLALTLSGIAIPADATPSPRTVPHLHATLRHSGDPDGSGTARFTLDRAHRKVCATVTWKKIDTPDAAHIHLVADGSIVVDLTGSVTGGPKCATRVPKATITAILKHPGRYYFNVHNPTYPGGAISGILKK